jgi:glycine/D-amino acid oxidase-like deaminating enzyme
MTKVVVVGGGVAGVSAALAASGRGSKTTLIESPDGWVEHDLILPQAESLSEAGVAVRTG